MHYCHELESFKKIVKCLTNFNTNFYFLIKKFIRFLKQCKIYYLKNQKNNKIALFIKNLINFGNAIEIIEKFWKKF